MIEASTPVPADDIGKRFLADHSDKELLRFITCGSVDDGKSTLIGRLLLEAGAVYDDQIAALQRESRKHGTTGQELDCALLLDGLEDERQQGITIDVAYRYFATSKRKFIIADTPGHEQFTRNMATGASTANLALILVDASKGLLTQTRRHAFIVSLLGIRHVVLAVNKMDLVNYDQSVFESICDEFREFASKLEIPDIRFVPLSALCGDNVAVPSSNMLWHEDASLLQLLETVYVGADANLRELRFPVQWVNRPTPDFRGFSGTVASGTLRVDDEVVVLPSNKEARVKRIVTRDGDLPAAAAPQAVTVTLDDEIDVSRGDMLARPGTPPSVSREADAMIVWMAEQPMTPGRQYWVKHTTKRTSGELSLRYAIDVNTLHRSPAVNLGLNEIGRCRVVLRDPIAFDSYRRNRETGSFILVDRISHETVAAGMLLDSDPRAGSEDHWDEQPASARLERATSLISDQERAARYQHPPYTVLITGLSGSGKTTLALELEKLLFNSGKKCVLLDGQNMRFGISRDLGFSAEERSENLRRAAEIAKLLNDAGVICIAAFVAPQDEVRKRTRDLVGPHRFCHVHLTAPLEVCQQRDSTGRYLAAERGEIADFPGVNAPYEPPEHPDLLFSTDSGAGPREIAASIVERLASHGPQLDPG
ncbi:Bifunctional enzyme CysN/CysC [Posidoniimonas polymericola]|uniref:Sulfate adenylyltransferase subunit 1 n=1 Tax=Posidoniimonas polymericola TaxID=2528002 RepID=A0A5C5YUA2_9BACT|nr:sulfate adenylyltransferase subunit CysN [Posidoniimonas polymericola]TWT78356.1 Bifunctional enzyme CysN/CysC [Posidoniimonas polymericola]